MTAAASPVVEDAADGPWPFTWTTPVRGMSGEDCMDRADREAITREQWRLIRAARLGGAS